MKLLKKILVVFLTVIGSILFIYSCGKKDREANELSTIASDDNDADNSFADLKNAGDQAGIKNSTKGYDKSKDTCFKVKVVSYDSINYKLNLVVDFGQNDCSCNDAKLRRGKINIEYNGEIGLVGSNVIYTPENYYVNGYGLN